MATSVLAPTLEAPPPRTVRKAPAPIAAASRSLPRRVRTLRRLVPLGAILALQAFLSYRLISSNTAFLDEATYLGAGHQLLHAWLHGGPDLHYATYFSGAPVIYPVIGALFDSLGGLEAARLFSMAVMLGATVLAYASGRRLAGTAAGWLAAGVFCTLQGTQFLGAFATFDAMSLGLVAMATWIVVRAGTARPRPRAWIYAAAPVMIFANATKYASAIYDPVILAVAFFVLAHSSGWRTAVRVTATLTSIAVAIVAALLAFAGRSYIVGITSTTTSRAKGTASASAVLHESLGWIGSVIVLAVLAAVALTVAAFCHRVTWAVALLGLVLAAATLLAPLNQARIQTTTSLSKHVDFGAWFGAVLAGILLSYVVGHGWRSIWRYLLLMPLLVPMLVAGSDQASSEFGHWFNSTRLIATLRPLVDHNSGPVLVDDVSVPEYYLGAGINPLRWVGTFYLSFHASPSGPALVGIPAYLAAVRESYFSVIALDWGDAKPVDTAVAQAISLNHRYHYYTKVFSHNALGNSAYVIWRLERT